MVHIASAFIGRGPARRVIGGSVSLATCRMPWMERQQLEQALKGHNADYVEVRVEESEATSLSYRGKELEEVGRTVNLGGCVRAAYQGGWGFVSFNSLDG